MAISFVNPPANVPPILQHHWQQIMLESPWHYNQVVGDDAPLNEGCPVYVQPNRDLITRQLYNAYSRIRSALSYDLQPTYHREKFRIGSGAPWQFQSFRSKWMKLKALGTRATTVIQANTAIVYSKSDSSLTADDTATITVAAPAGVTNTDEIQAFFRTADGAPGAADARWQIAPLAISLSGGNFVLTGHRSLFVKPSVWKAPFVGTNQTTRNNAVTTDANNFVTQVDVYRVYTDDTQQVTLITDPLAAWCSSNPTDTSVTQTAVGWLEQEDAGLFRVRLDRGVCLTAFPEYVQVNYLAGEDWQYGDMDNEFAQALVHLTNTLLPQTPCELCNQANASYQDDVNVKVQRAGKGGSYVESDPSPFGTQVGSHRAWQIVKERRIIRAGKLTSRG